MILLDPFADLLGLDASIANLHNIVQASLGDQVLYPLLDRRVRRMLRQPSDACCNGIQIDVGCNCEDGLFVQNRDRFEATLEEGSAALLFTIDFAREGFTNE